MTKIRLPALRPGGALTAPWPAGARLRRLFGVALVQAWQCLQAAASACGGATGGAVTIEGYYGDRAVSMRLDRDDVRHYARLAQQHGLQPSLGGYLDFRIRTADFPLPSPLERAMAGFTQGPAGPRADQFLFVDPGRAEQDFLRLLDS